MAARVMPLFCALLLVAAVAAAQDARPSTQRAVNINTATADQLQLLPGVGPALAGRIIAFREANGPFNKVDELTAVQGIGDKSLEKLRPYVVTNGATNLTAKVRLPRPEKAAADE